jgi:hypothetical protein
MGASFALNDVERGLHVDRSSICCYITVDGNRRSSPSSEIPYFGWMMSGIIDDLVPRNLDGWEISPSHEVS